MSLGSKGVDRVRSCGKFERDFMAQTFALVQPVLHRVSQDNQTVSNASKQYEMHQNMSLGSNGVDRVRSLLEIPTRLRGTNFSTSSARFGPSFVSKPNYSKCSQIVRNAPKHEFRMQWGGSGVFIAKNFDATSWKQTFCTSSAHFAPSFVRRSNCPKQYKMRQNMSLGSNRVDRVRSLQKISTRLRGTNFCTNLAHFASSLVRQPNSPKCTQIVQNAPKHEFRVQWGGSGTFVVKNSDATLCYELLHQFSPFCTDFRKATKWS